MLIKQLSDDELRARRREYHAKPEVKAKKREYQREYYLQKLKPELAEFHAWKANREGK